MDVASFVDHLRVAAQRDRQMVHVEELPYRDAAHGELRNELPPRLREALGDRGGVARMADRTVPLDEALVQVVDAALAVGRRLGRVHPDLEAARVGDDVAGELGGQLAGRAAKRG